MTMLEQFVSFANQLPADRLQSVEANLAALMASYSEKYDFTAAELAELDSRVDKADPEFAHPDDIAKLFGKPFSA